MMEEDTQDEDIPDDHRATEIHTYLNSFKKEIQAVAGEEAAVKIGESTEYEHEVKKDVNSQDVLMYYASADGTLYSANALQTGLPQSVTHTSESAEQNRNEATVEGFQQVVVTLGESGEFILSNANNLSYALSTTQQGSTFKDNSKSTPDLKKLSNVVVMQPARDINQENVYVKRTPNGISKVGSDLSNNFPQIYQLISSEAEQAMVKDSTVETPVMTSSAYQTVTIMPSDTNPGQLNYVLFVSPVDTKLTDDSSKLLTVDGEIADERTEVFDPPPDRSLNAYTCQYCDYTSFKRYLLSRHMKSHSDERPHKCKVCKKGFKTVASLQNHVNTHTKTRPHACKECDSTFTTSGELLRHMRYKHTHERPHRCTECDYASVELSKLKRHMRCHTGERPYQCPHCTYASPDTYKLKRHLRTHTGEKPYTCNICQTRFTQSNSLKAHLLIHTGNKPSYQCMFCPATCGRKTDLRIHIQKLHSSDKMHKCKRCEKTFKDKYSFKVHCKTHDGEKSFKCDACPFVTISLQQFEAHSLTHSTEDLYQCMICSDSFSHKQLLKQHMKACHNSPCDLLTSKDIKCPECGKAFRHHENMICHTAIHDPEASSAKREQAMQIGRPKEPGEVQDGEEDELSDEDNFNDDQAVFELLHFQKISEEENKNIPITNGQLLTLTENGNEYTIVPRASGESAQTVISLSNAMKVGHEFQVPLKIEFEGENSDTEISENCQAESEMDGNDDHSHKLYDSKKSPQIIQIAAQHHQIPISMDANESNTMNEDGEV